MKMIDANIFRPFSTGKQIRPPLVIYYDQPTMM